MRASELLFEEINPAGDRCIQIFKKEQQNHHAVCSDGGFVRHGNADINDKVGCGETRSDPE